MSLFAAWLICVFRLEAQLAFCLYMHDVNFVAVS